MSLPFCPLSILAWLSSFHEKKQKAHRPSQSLSTVNKRGQSTPPSLPPLNPEPKRHRRFSVRRLRRKTARPISGAASKDPWKTRSRLRTRQPKLLPGNRLSRRRARSGRWTRMPPPFRTPSTSRCAPCWATSVPISSRYEFVQMESRVALRKNESRLYQ